MINLFLSQLRWSAKTEWIVEQIGMEFMEPASVCLKMHFGSKASDKKKYLHLKKLWKKKPYIMRSFITCAD